MRISIVVALLVAGSPAFADPIDGIARAARGRANEPLTLAFDATACVMRAAGSGSELAVPLRKVTWSMTKETDGSGDAVVTARCEKASACITGGKAAAPRFSFRLAASARDARKLFGDLKGLAAQCSQ